jgi:hypothetical protein
MMGAAMVMLPKHEEFTRALRPLTPPEKLLGNGKAIELDAADLAYLEKLYPQPPYSLFSWFPNLLNWGPPPPAGWLDLP